MIERISANMSCVTCKFMCPIIALLSPFMTTKFKLKLLQMSTSRGIVSSLHGHVDVGHGQSEGELVLVRDIEELTCPVIQHCREKGKENHGVPQFIIRHSQGGLIHSTSFCPPSPLRWRGCHVYFMTTLRWTHL